MLLSLENKPVGLPETFSAEPELDVIKEEMETKAREFIKDDISKMSWEDFQKLVAGILRAMGYKTRISPKGSDRGKDIQASRDGLGLEGSRIVVEVKHRDGPMGTKEIRSFIGGLREGNRGLYVSSGGFSKEAKYEADRAHVPLTLIDLDDLVELLIQHYDSSDAEIRSF